MQRGTYPDEAQGTLGHDDVAGLRYAMSGVDGRAGTADDYALVLEYAGLDAGADIVIGFDDNETAFAAAKTRARVGGGRAFIVDSRVYFNDSFNWFFNGAGGTGGGGGPDLVVQWAAVSDRTLTPGQSFTFSATVRNIGDARSLATTLDYRRRPAGGSFTVVDTASVGGLSPSGASPESVRLTAPRQVGTSEYEACVTAVSGESDTGNNRSVVVGVTVSSGGGGSCTNDLGPVSGTVTRAGSWDGSCDSVHYADGRCARCYSFRLSQIASVTIDLNVVRGHVPGLAQRFGNRRRTDRGRRRRRTGRERADHPVAGGRRVHHRGDHVRGSADGVVHVDVGGWRGRGPRPGGRIAGSQRYHPHGGRVLHVLGDRPQSGRPGVCAGVVDLPPKAERRILDGGGHGRGHRALAVRQQCRVDRSERAGAGGATSTGRACRRFRGRATPGTTARARCRSWCRSRRTWWWRLRRSAMAA